VRFDLTSRSPLSQRMRTAGATFAVVVAVTNRQSPWINRSGFCVSRGYPDTPAMAIDLLVQNREIRANTLGINPSAALSACSLHRPVAPAPFPRGRTSAARAWAQIVAESPVSGNVVEQLVDKAKAQHASSHRPLGTRHRLLQIRNSEVCPAG